MSEFSVEELDNIAKMGRELGIQYSHLWQEVAWLHAKWGEFTVLFGSKKERIDLLNQAASGFFKIVQDTMRDDTFLHLARLTDPPKSSGKENLTIQNLPNLITDATLKVEVSALVTQAVAKTAFCRDWRNRYIAHRDLPLATSQQHATPLATASRVMVKEALVAIAAVLNRVQKHFSDFQTIYDIDSNLHGGAIDLLYLLDDGIKTQGRRSERLERGEYIPEEDDPKDI
jgi:hypothetical protein